jgi:hypothetical protein
VSELSAKDHQNQICDKWTQIRQERKQQLRDDIKAEYDLYLKENGAFPDDIAKNELAEKICGIAEKNGIQIAKPVLKKHAYNELTKLNRCEKMHQSKGNRQGKAERGMELFHMPRINDDYIRKIISR